MTNPLDTELAKEFERVKETHKIGIVKAGIKLFPQLFYDEVISHKKYKKVNYKSKNIIRRIYKDQEVFNNIYEMYWNKLKNYKVLDECSNLVN